MDRLDRNERNSSPEKRCQIDAAVPAYREALAEAEEVVEDAAEVGQRLRRIKYAALEYKDNRDAMDIDEKHNGF